MLSLTVGLTGLLFGFDEISICIKLNFIRTRVHILILFWCIFMCIRIGQKSGLFFLCRCCVDCVVASVVQSEIKFNPRLTRVRRCLEIHTV